MSRKAQAKSSKAMAIVYPAGCQELQESLIKDELVKRLKDLYVKFQEFDQDDVNNEKYKPLACFLASRFFLDHSDREVKVFTACILADAMRIFAPNAPFTNSQLKNVLRFFVKQLHELQHHSLPIFRHVYYLLDVISSTRVFCAYLEFEEECPSFFCEVINCVLSNIRKEHATNVKSLVVDLCVPLIQESPSVTPEIVDCLFSRLIEPSRSSNSIAYKLVLDIILRAKDCLENVISDFFRSTMLGGPSGEWNTSKDAYAILFELCTGSPDVVHNILNDYLRDALELPQENLRLAAVRFAGQLFAKTSGVGAIFAAKYGPLWTTYLGRSKDASSSIRTHWVKQAAQILCAQTLVATDEQDISKAIYERLITRATDIDAAIRIAVIDAAVMLAQHNISSVPDDMLKKLEELTRDKHTRTRTSAILALGKIYRRACISSDKRGSHSDDADAGDSDFGSVPSGNMLECSPEQKSRLQWICNKILHLYATNAQLEDRALVERVLYACLVPVTTLDIKQRLTELVSLYVGLDENAVGCFDSLIRFQAQLREVVYRWANAAVTNNTTTTSQVTVLMRMLPQDSCPQEALVQLDRLLYTNKLLAERLRAACDPRCSSTKAGELATDIVKIVSAEQKQKSSILPTAKFILERTLPLLISGPSLIGILRMVLSLTGGCPLSNKEITLDHIVPILKLCLLIATIFKSACLQVDSHVLVEELPNEGEDFKFVLDQFVSLFDQVVDPEALSLVAQIIPHLVGSHKAFENQSQQFYMTVHALQSTLGQLALRSHVTMAKQCVKCLIHLLPPSEYVRVIKPIVDCRIIQITSVMRKISAFEESISSSTADLTPSDSPPLPDVDIQPAVVGYYSVGRVATYLPKSFFSDMRNLAVDSHEWLTALQKKPDSFYPSLRVAAIKFLARWLCSLRQDQSIPTSAVKRIADCISAHIHNNNSFNYENKDSLYLCISAVSASFRLLRSSEVLLAALPASTVIALALFFEKLDIRLMRNSARPLLVKIQRHFVARMLPPLALAVLACSFVSNDKEARSMMRQVVEKLFAAWRLQAQHGTTTTTANASSAESGVVPLNTLPDSLLPGAIVLYSFIATNNIDQLESCRSALSGIFDVITSAPSMPNSGEPLKTSFSSEHLPMCRGLLNKIKVLSSSVSSSFKSPEYVSSWSENSLQGMVNVALAELPQEKGGVKNEDAFAINIETKPFLQILGPLCEIFHNNGDKKQKIQTEEQSNLSSPQSGFLVNSGKSNQQTAMIGKDVTTTPVLHSQSHTHAVNLSDDTKEITKESFLAESSHQLATNKPELNLRKRKPNAKTDEVELSSSASDSNCESPISERPTRAKRKTTSPVAAPARAKPRGGRRKC